MALYTRFTIGYFCIQSRCPKSFNTFQCSEPISLMTCLDSIFLNSRLLICFYFLFLFRPTSHETRQTNVIISFFGVFLIMHAWVYNWPTNQTFFCRELQHVVTSSDFIMNTCDTIPRPLVMACRILQGLNEV